MASSFTALVLCSLALLGGAAPVRFAFVSDFHLDPFYATADAEGRRCRDAAADRMGTIGCDSSMALVASAVGDVVNSTRPEFVVCGGDWLRHDMAGVVQAHPAAPKTTYARIAALFRNYSGHVLPTPNLVTPLGNNDFVPDYFFDITKPAPPLLHDMATILVDHGLLRASEHGGFSRAGFYSRDAGALQLLVLNTLLWDVDLSPHVATTADPLGQFAFLTQELRAARAAGRKVLIVSHIPPTINFFGVANGKTEPSKASYWQAGYQARYLALLAEFNTTVTAQLFAHTHRFSFVADPAVGVPLFIMPAVSPVYFNDPNYLVASLDDRSWRIMDLCLRRLPLSEDGAAAQWADGPCFKRSYDLPAAAPLDVPMVHSVARRLMDSTGDQAAWSAMYAGGLHDVCDARCRRLASCTAQHLNATAILACWDAAPPTPSPGPVPSIATTRGVLLAVVCVTLAALAIAAGIYIVRERRRGRFEATPVPEHDLEEVEY